MRQKVIVGLLATISLLPFAGTGPAQAKEQHTLQLQVRQ